MKRASIVLLFLCGMLAQPKISHAQVGLAQVINMGIKKVVKAFDLKVQRLQNKTIWLQNAQKTMENTLSKLKLREISDWTERQRLLYSDYFEELGKVKTIISYYHRIRDIGSKQGKLLKAYQKAWDVCRQDAHFSAKELAYMSKVYTGILEESVNNIDQILLVVKSFQTQMSDAQRLQLIRKAAEATDRNYRDLLQFNRQNILLSLARSKDDREAQMVKSLYGIL